MTADPFTVLGLPSSADADQVRRARRDLAKQVHPDVGGDAAAMRSINDAAAAALRSIAERRLGSSVPAGETNGSADASADPMPGSPQWRRGRRDAPWFTRDAPSFTVEALPVETFEALLLAAAALGEVEDDDPPYGLDVLMSAPLGCWCHLSVVPDAGASTVSLSVAPEPDQPLPPIERVRDAWITELNSLDWSALA